MAADNDDAISPSFILETVQAANSMLSKKTLGGARASRRDITR